MATAAFEDRGAGIAEPSGAGRHSQRRFASFHVVAPLHAHSQLAQCVPVKQRPL